MEWRHRASQPAKLQNITAEWPGPVSGIMREGDMNIYCCNAHKKRILQVECRERGTIYVLVRLEIEISALSGKNWGFDLLFLLQRKLVI